MSDYAERLEKTYSCVIYDALTRLGHSHCVLPNEIRPIDINTKTAGSVYTVRGHIDFSLGEEETLLAWVRLLSKVPPDSVVICQPNNNEIALMGELSAETLKSRGVRGYIVDGGCRDSSFIEKLEFPVFCKFFTSVDIVGKWIPDAFEIDIRIGDVTIQNGDYVMADRDSTVIIPHRLIDNVISIAEEMVTTENAVRLAILKGVDPEEAYLEHGKF